MITAARNVPVGAICAFCSGVAVCAKDGETAKKKTTKANKQRMTIPSPRNYATVQGCGPSYPSMMMISIFECGCRTLMLAWYSGER